MTTEASKSDLTAALTQLSHNLEALPGKIAAQVAAEVAALKPRRSPSAEGPTTMTTEASKSDSLTEVAAALKPKAPLPMLLVGGKDIPFLLLHVDMGADDAFEGHFTVASEHADLLRVNSTIEIRRNGKLMCRTGLLLSTRQEGDTIVCRAASSADKTKPA